MVCIMYAFGLSSSMVILGKIMLEISMPSQAIIMVEIDPRDAITPASVNWVMLARFVVVAKQYKPYIAAELAPKIRKIVRLSIIGVLQYFCCSILRMNRTQATVVTLMRMRQRNPIIMPEAIDPLLALIRVWEYSAISGDHRVKIKARWPQLINIPVIVAAR